MTPKHITALFDMTGRTAIITGGGTHLGTQMSRTLGQLGASVYLASRRAEASLASSWPSCRSQGLR